MLSLDSTTGVKKWEYLGQPEKPLVAVYSTPMLQDGIVYFGAYDGNFYALDAATGVPKWSAPFPVGSPVVPTPLLALDVHLAGMPGQPGAASCLSPAIIAYSRENICFDDARRPVSSKKAVIRTGNILHSEFR